MSTQGWVTDLSSKIDYLLAHYVSTDQEQSNVYRNNISNLQYVVENHNNDPIGAAAAIGRSVQTFLGRYYSNVIADATFSLSNEGESQTTVKITLALNFTEDGVTYTANRLLTYFNGKFKSIVEANNG